MTDSDSSYKNGRGPKFRFLWNFEAKKNFTKFTKTLISPKVQDILIPNFTCLSCLFSKVALQEFFVKIHKY